MQQQQSKNVLSPREGVRRGEGRGQGVFPGKVTRLCRRQNRTEAGVGQVRQKLCSALRKLTCHKRTTTSSRGFPLLTPRAQASKDLLHPPPLPLPLQAIPRQHVSDGFNAPATAPRTSIRYEYGMRTTDHGPRTTTMCLLHMTAQPQPQPQPQRRVLAIYTNIYIGYIYPYICHIRNQARK